MLPRWLEDDSNWTRDTIGMYWPGKSGSEYRSVERLINRQREECARPPMVFLAHSNRDSTLYLMNKTDFRGQTTREW